MKCIPKILLLMLLAAVIPFYAATGQETKTEKKVKVVIADKDGTTIVIDTTYNGDSPDQVLTLKNGKTIHLATTGTMSSHMSGENGKNIYITTTSDGSGKTYKEEKVIVMHGNDGEWTIKSSDDADVDIHPDMTKYVMAKDGVVITVESRDEAKAKKILEELEKNMDIK